MPVDLAALLSDLSEESEALVGRLVDLDESSWDRPTPAPGWTVKDQVTHLAFFDEAQVRAALNPAVFSVERGSVLVDVDGATQGVAERYRALTGRDTLVWFDQARSHLVEVFARLDAATRIPWYGPDMSVASAVTARLMETWAHGQDIADALGQPASVSARLAHIAHIGVRALPNSYRARRLDVPTDPVRVELTGPGGQIWEWGPVGVPNRVSGPALDFCWVVTQRRHLADTSLAVEGDVAQAWMSIAQAYAGPPGEGRAPGQFGDAVGRA